VETTRHVGAGDDPEHGVVIAEAPDAKALAQISVEVVTSHLPSLLRDLGHSLIEQAIDCRCGVLAEQAHPRFGDDLAVSPARVRFTLADLTGPPIILMKIVSTRK
jgi:hypothetical protein